MGREKGEPTNKPAASHPYTKEARKQNEQYVDEVNEPWAAHILK